MLHLIHIKTTVFHQSFGLDLIQLLGFGLPPAAHNVLSVSIFQGGSSPHFFQIFRLLFGPLFQRCELDSPFAFVDGTGWDASSLFSSVWVSVSFPPCFKEPKTCAAAQLKLGI